MRASPHFLDWANQPVPFKRYRGLPAVPLPRALPEGDAPALAALGDAGAPGEGGALAVERVPDRTALARLLHLSAGITKSKRIPGGELHLRAHPNTGALYHVDVYVVSGALPDLEPGVYHFAPDRFALERLRAGDHRAALFEAAGGEPRMARAPVVLASASTWWRNAWKYRARAWRHCFWDAGTLHANLLAVAGADGLDPRVVLGFADAPVERLLGLDPAREGAIALVPIGAGPDAPPPAPPAPALELEVEPLSRSEVEYPEIRAAQAASSLAGGAEAAAWRGAPPERPEPAPGGRLTALRPLAGADLPRETLDRVIRRRGSTRAFDPDRAISFEALSTALDRAARRVPADFLDAPGASLVDLYLIVNAVDGLAPGAYFLRRRDRALELLREGDFRRTAGRLALGQTLAADAAASVYCLADLGPLLDRFGNRGYRAAQLEGGITGGRLYLSAYAQRFGATGLTFFDDDVTDFFSPHAAGKSVLFLTALGYADRQALGLS